MKYIWSNLSDEEERKLVRTIVCRMVNLNRYHGGNEESLETEKLLKKIGFTKEDFEKIMKKNAERFEKEVKEKLSKHLGVAS